MDFLEKFFGRNLLFYIMLFILGVLILFGQISSKTIGWIVIFISIFGVIYEGKLRYYIKFKKSNKNVKSLQELFITQYFEKKKIKCIYEPFLRLGKETLHPDFFLPEFDIYVEYWGRWNSDFEYRKECRYKKQLYEKYGKRLIELFPDNLVTINQLDWKFTERLLKILKEDRA